MTIEELREAVRYAFEEWQQAGPRHVGKIDEVRDAVLAALDEVEAMRPMVELVRRSDGRVLGDRGFDYCFFCGAETGALFTGLEDDSIPHKDECFVLTARRLAGKEPTA